VSAAHDLQALLLADTALTAVVGERIAIDQVEQGVERPYIVFSTQGVDKQLGLDGTLLGRITTIDIQCCGADRDDAITVADLVEVALAAASQDSDRGTTGYDADNGLEVEVVTVDWIET